MNPVRLDEALLEALQRKCRESVEVKQHFFDSQGVDVLHAAHVLADSYRNGGKLYTFGNGGEMARAGYVELCLVVHSDSIHRVQETHVAIYHVLWDLVHSLLADDRPAKGMR